MRMIEGGTHDYVGNISDRRTDKETKKQSPTYLSRIESDNQVCNESVFRLSGSVRDHDSPTGVLGGFTSLNRFAHRTNLVHLKWKSPF